MSSDDRKRAAAARAVELIEPGMRLGLGTGSTARHFVELLASRVRGGLKVVGVPTSEITCRDAERLGIPLTTLDETPQLDLTVDGADEIAPDLAALKGGGGALLREKIVAAASAGAHDRDRRRAQAGAGTGPLCAAGRGGVPFGLAATRRAVEAAAAASLCPGPAVLRRTAQGHPFVTDDGHFILDVALHRIAIPPALALRLAGIPGVVEHGLFIGLVGAAIVAGEGGVRMIEALR